MTRLDIYLLARVVFLDMPDARVRLYDEDGLLRVEVRAGSIWETLEADGIPAMRRWRAVKRISSVAVNDDLFSADYPGGWHPFEVATRLLELRRRHVYPDREITVLPEFEPIHELNSLLGLLDRERLERQLDHLEAGLPCR